ncbi:MAG: LysR family transcriptional regulator [Comamonadaceae bacterium]|nr:MAG: LysR family transcriptional regulator [Comamonadaceae bacterium]
MRNTKMEIDDLRTFVEVAQAGGVSAAAVRLGVSKSIVSRRLVRLEDDLGVQLLTRSTRGAALTEAGATFQDYAARICSELDVARETILPAGDLRGRLRIAVPLTFGPTHFAPMLAEMARRHPHLQIQTCYSDRFVDLISEGFDCAIRVGYLEDSMLVARSVGRILVAAAVAGLGIAYLPDWLTHEHVVAGTLVPVMTRYPPPVAGAYVVRPPGLHPARKIRVLTELLIEYCDQLPNRA